MKILFYYFVLNINFTKILASKKHFFEEIYIKNNEGKLILTKIENDKEKVSIEIFDTNEFIWKFHYKDFHYGIIHIYTIIVEYFYEFKDNFFFIKHNDYQTIQYKYKSLGINIIFFPCKLELNKNIVKIKENYEKFIKYSFPKKKLIHKFNNIYLKNNLQVSIDENYENIFLEKIENKSSVNEEFNWYFLYFLEGNSITFIEKNLIYKDDQFICNEKEEKNLKKKKIFNETFKKYKECLFNKNNYSMDKNSFSVSLIDEVYLNNNKLISILNNNEEKVFLKKKDHEEYVWYFYYFKKNNINVITIYISYKDEKFLHYGKNTQIFHFNIEKDKILSSFNNFTYEKYQKYIYDPIHYELFNNKSNKKESCNTKILINMNNNP